MKKVTIASGIVALALFATPLAFVSASSGVSVDTGKVVLNAPLVPGGRYQLPNIEVKNTGTEPSNYSVSVDYNEVQSQMKPAADWFAFSPTSPFLLQPGESAIVKTAVTVPVTAQAGEYFAYIEAQSHTAAEVKNPVSGAAATKLYFSVVSASPLVSGYYGTRSYVKEHGPWTYVVLWILAALIAFGLLRRVHHLAKRARQPKQ